MHWRDHEQTSLEQFGCRFSKVHQFLDQYFGRFRFLHRVIFHHKRGLDIIEEKFGADARRAAEIHIREDSGGELPVDWNGYIEEVVGFEAVPDDPEIISLLKEYFPDYSGLL